MKKKTKIIISLILLFILSYTIIYSITKINKQQRIQTALNSHLDKLEIQYKTLIHHWRVTANAVKKSTTGMTKVMEIYHKVQTANEKEKTILRKQLYKTMINKYNAMRTKGVSGYSFILPDKTVLLRMSNPNKFGDNVSSSYRVEYVTEYKKPIYGYAKGKFTPAFRNTYPIFSKSNDYLGALIVSFSSDVVADYLSNVSKIYSHFLIHKDIINTKINQGNTYITSIEHPDYLINISNKNYNKKHIGKETKIIKPIKTEVNFKLKQGDKFSLYTSFNNKATVISFYPIKNIRDKKTVAWIVSYDNDDFIELTLKGNLVINIVAFLILLLLFYFIYRVLNQKELLDIQVKEKTDDLAKINRELEESEYELQIINENLEETIKNEVTKNQEKDKLVFQQSKMVSMGEMIGNIAHQWRQPLSVISTAATGIQMQKKYGVLTDELLDESCTAININAQYLSKTIDDFKNFIKGDREKTIFNLENEIKSFLHLVEGSIKNHNINIVLDLEENIQIDGYENELTQCFINIFNNAKDVLKEINKENNRLIFISTYKQNKNIIIKIKDNGGGIPEDILPRIFDPYFTTKHKSQGTGLGLNMTYKLIVDGMGGTIKAHNCKYKYNGKDYIGAEFKITLS